MSETNATLYLSHNCKACLEVLSLLESTSVSGVKVAWVHPAIDSNTLAKEHILLATGARINTIPALPALSHQDKLLVGKDEVVAYIKLNIGKL